MIKKLGYALVAIMAMTVVQSDFADAASCAQKGRSLAASKGGKFLSAQPSGSNCRIVILVKSGN